MLKTVTKTTRVEISTLSKKGRFALEHSSQLFHLNTCLNSMGFVAVSTLIKTHFHVFSTHPNLELIPTHLKLFNTHPSWNTHFSLGTSTPSANSCCTVEF